MISRTSGLNVRVKTYAAAFVRVLGLVCLTSCRLPPSTGGASFGGQFFFAGEPKSVSYPNPLERLENTAYVVAYDETRKDPAWGAYRIPGSVQFGPLPRPSRFSTDDRTIAKVSHDDYTNSGYDRGHMVPNLAIASRFGPDAQAETFFMSNVVPQKAALNQGPWRLLEAILADTTAPKDGEIWVVVGPIFEGRYKN